MSAFVADWANLLLKAGVPVAAALAGGVVGAAGPRRGSGATAPLVQFASGAFLGIAVLHLLPEGASHCGWLAALLAALCGGALSRFLTRWGGGCPTCDGHSTDQVLHFQLGFPLMLVVAIHCVLDGLALAGSGHVHHAGELLTLAILIHKLPEGLAIAALARAGGVSPLRALAITAGVESFTFLGAGIGAALSLEREPLLGGALAAIAGSFLYLVFLSLNSLPSTPRPFRSAFVTLAGMLLIVAARLSFG